MRNPFARIARRDDATPTLRERLNATKAKARQVFAVNKVLLTPRLKPATASDRPLQPRDLPTPDAGLWEASDDLARIDRAIDGLLTGSEHREGDTLPVYGALEEAREEALSRLTEERARGLTGLQAKARALLSRGISSDHHDTHRLAQSLARDLVGSTNHAIEPQADPIFAMIEEGRRLSKACANAHLDYPQDPTTSEPREEWGVASDTLFDHVNEAILATVPRTAAGCRELARFQVEFSEDQGVPISVDAEAVARLIAKSPLL